MHMCLGIPMELMKREGENMGIARLGVLEKKVSLALLDDVEVGDYLIVHAGFAIQKLDKEEALKTLEIFGEMGYEVSG